MFLDGLAPYAKGVQHEQIGSYATKSLLILPIPMNQTQLRESKQSTGSTWVPWQDLSLTLLSNRAWIYLSCAHSTTWLLLSNNYIYQHLLETVKPIHQDTARQWIDDIVIPYLTPCSDRESLSLPLSQTTWAIFVELVSNPHKGRRWAWKINHQLVKQPPADLTTAVKVSLIRDVSALIALHAQWSCLSRLGHSILHSCSPTRSEQSPGSAQILLRFIVNIRRLLRKICDKLANVIWRFCRKMKLDGVESAQRYQGLIRLRPVKYVNFIS